MAYDLEGYRTSTRVGHEYRHPRLIHFEERNLQIPEAFQPTDEVAKVDRLRSTTGTLHDWKNRGVYDKTYPQAPPLFRLHFQHTLADKFLQDPPKPMPFKKSEYMENYTMKQVDKPRANIVGPDPEYICKAAATGRDYRPPVLPNEPGILKHLDPYCTTTQMAHYPILPEFSANRDHEDDWNSYWTKLMKVHPPSRLHFIVDSVPTQALEFMNYSERPGFIPVAMDSAIPPLGKSMVDTRVFKEKKMVCVHKPPGRVPNKGMLTEKQENYRWVLQPSDSSSVGACAVYNQSSPHETFSIPGMYSTDNFHIGTGWPVRSVVDPGSSLKKY